MLWGFYNQTGTNGSWLTFTGIEKGNRMDPYLLVAILSLLLLFVLLSLAPLLVDQLKDDPGDQSTQPETKTAS